MCTYTLIYSPTVCLQDTLWEWTERYSKAMKCCSLDIYVYNSVDITVHTHVYVWVLNGILHLAKCCPTGILPLQWRLYVMI